MVPSSLDRTADAGHFTAYLEFTTSHYDRAIDDLREAIRKKADLSLYFDLGVVYERKGEFSEAIVAFANAGSGDALYNAAILASRMGDDALARKYYRQALRAYPKWAVMRAARAWLGSAGAGSSRLRLGCAWCNLGLETPEIQDVLAEIYFKVGAVEQAYASFEKAIGLAPTAARHFAYANALRLRGRFVDSEKHFRASLALDANSPQVLIELGYLYELQGFFDAAREQYQSAVTRDSTNAFAQSRILKINAIEGDLRGAERAYDALRRSLDERPASAYHWEQLCTIAYRSLMWPLSDRQYNDVTAAIDHQIAASIPVDRSPKLHRSSSHESSAIRVGYLIEDLGRPPIGQVTSELYAEHDRERFEVHVFTLKISPNPYAASITNAASIHVVPRDSAAIANAIRTIGIEVLVYLDGYMNHLLMHAIARRPAPIQVFWLGHAGGLELSCIDYLIADSTVVPSGEDGRYRAKIARLPGLYHCASKEPVSASPSRQDEHLPQDAFVFCGFNNSEKINLAVFRTWMRILSAVDNSVLWLSAGKSPALEQNFKREAEICGIAGSRLVFGRFLANKADHLARHRLAGLFLDTITLNASTTALDALWAGLPVLAFKGDRFSNRISSTFLQSIGLDDMISTSIENYEHRAIQLARDPVALDKVRERLAHNLKTHPLFQMRTFCAHFEEALSTMSKIYRSGRAYRSFDVN